MQTIHLQGIGRCHAIPAERLEPGMVLSWNYSPLAYEVVSVKFTSLHYMQVVERNIETGVEYTRKLKRDRLVVASKPKGQT